MIYLFNPCHAYYNLHVFSPSWTISSSSHIRICECDMCFEKKQKNTVAALSIFSFCQAAKGNANRAFFPFHRGRFLVLRPALAVTQQPDRRRPFGCPVDVKECHRDEPRRSVQRRVDGSRVYLRLWCADQRVLAGCELRCGHFSMRHAPQDQYSSRSCVQISKNIDKPGQFGESVGLTQRSMNKQHCSLCWPLHCVPFSTRTRTSGRDDMVRQRGASESAATNVVSNHARAGVGLYMQKRRYERPIGSVSDDPWTSQVSSTQPM
jgi:hypothetical protein